MRPSTLLAASLLLTVGLAGCLVGDERAPPPPAFTFVDPLSSAPDHDHRDRAQHQGVLNMTLVGHEPLVDQDGETPNSHSIDLCENWVVLGRERPGENGVDIVDVSDPANPVWVGRYRDEKAVPGDRDVAWSADCNYVFMANGGSQPDNSGVLVINARDKAKPTFESRYQVPGTPGVPGAPVGGVTSSVHTVYALAVDGVQYVYALNWGVHILRLTTGLDGKASLQFVGRYASADAERLAMAPQADPNAQTAIRRTVYGHDMSVYREGSTVMLYVAYAYDGLRIVDITNPQQPRAVGHWAPDATPGAPHYVHSVKTFRYADGRRITVLGSETFEDRNLKTPSPLWTLDTTNPGDVKLLDTWTNPGGHGADRLLFSLHFYEVEDDLVWLTHYHGGVWVLDIADPTDIRVRGYYMPAKDTGFVPEAGCCFGWNWAGMPMTFDLKVRDGFAYAADFHTGLYVLRLAA